MRTIKLICRTIGLKRSHLRYAVFRWVMPYLQHEPLANINLAHKAWPTVAALSANREYTDAVESPAWEPIPLMRRETSTLMMGI